MQKLGVFRSFKWLSDRGFEAFGVLLTEKGWGYGIAGLLGSFDN